GQVRDGTAARIDGSSGCKNAREGGLRLLAHGVARADMTDLVPEHGGELRLGIEVGHDPAGDIDVSAGQRESVDVLAVDDREVPLERRTLAVLRQGLADLVDVIL